MMINSYLGYVLVQMTSLFINYLPELVRQSIKHSPNIAGECLMVLIYRFGGVQYENIGDVCNRDFFIFGYLGVRYLFVNFDDQQVKRWEKVKDSEIQHIIATIVTSHSTKDKSSNDNATDDEDISVQNNDFDTFTGEKAASDINEICRIRD